MPEKSTTTTAQWEEIHTEFVEIVFGTKSLAKKDIEEFVRNHADGDFTIIGYEEDKITGETKVIIKFTDKEAAENFVETVREASNKGGKGSVKVSFYYKDVDPNTMRFIPFTVLFMAVF